MALPVPVSRVDGAESALIRTMEEWPTTKVGYRAEFEVRRRVKDALLMLDDSLQTSTEPTLEQWGGDPCCVL